MMEDRGEKIAVVVNNIKICVDCCTVHIGCQSSQIISLDTFCAKIWQIISNRFPW